MMDQMPGPASHGRPPSKADMIHELVGNQGQNLDTETLARPALDRLQMSWAADVEDVYPVTSPVNFLFLKEIPNPLKRVYITSLSDSEKVVAALKTSLESWSSLRTIAVEYDQTTRLLVVLRATERYFGQAISTHANVDNEQALTEMPMSGNHAASELPRGLLFRIVVAYVERTKTVGVVVLSNHAIHDAYSIIGWGKDVEALIMGSSIAKRTPHKVFEEAYYLHRTSLTAKLAGDYQVDRFQGIASMRHALWPRPELFDRAPARDGVPNNEGKLEAVEGAGHNNPHVFSYRRFRNFATIRHKPSTIVYAAIASFNASITGSKFALFATPLAGREWPFINNSLAQLLPDPMSIAGPTLAISLAIVNVNDTEHISQFLARLEGELRLMRRCQHVPRDFSARLGEEDRAVVLNAYRQAWNHVPKGTSSNDSVSGDEPWRLISDTRYRVDRSEKAFIWETEVQDAETLSIRAGFNSDMFSQIEVERFTESVLDAVGFLSDSGNWGKEFCELRAMLSLKQSELAVAGIAGPQESEALD